jgi:hypothetical protein
VGEKRSAYQKERKQTCRGNGIVWNVILKGKEKTRIRFRNKKKTVYVRNEM